MKINLSTIFLSSMLILGALNSNAMTADNTEPAGLTVLGALELLCNAQKEEKGVITVLSDNPHAPKLGIIFLVTTGICGASIAIPGIMPGTFLGGIFCQYQAFWDGGSCQALIGSAVAPLVLNLVNGAAWTLASPFYNRWARESNAKVAATGVELIQRELIENQPLLLEDFQKIVPYVFDASDDLLKQLSLQQALALARSNNAKFAALVERSAFDAQVQENAQIYLDVIDMNLDALAGYLQDSETKSSLKKQPALLEGLILALPTSALYHPSLSKSLLACVKEVYKRDNSAQLFDHFRQRLPYENFEIAGLSLQKGSTIQLKNSSGNERIWLELDQCANIPTKFANQKVINNDVKISLLPSNTFELSFLELLTLAREQKLANLIEQFDFSLRLNGISEELLAQWLAEQGIDAPANNYINRWNFCCHFDLTKTKDRIVKQLTKELNTFTQNSDVFQAIAALDKDSRDGIFKQFDGEGFKATLASPTLLRWFGDVAIEFKLEQLTGIIGDFCQGNKVIAYEAWHELPKAFASSSKQSTPETDM